MSRPDLKPGYEGWQALDPTPQEKSEGGYAWPPSLGGKAKPWRELPDSASAGGSRARVLTPVPLAPETTDRSAQVWGSSPTVCNPLLYHLKSNSHCGKQKIWRSAKKKIK